LELDPFPWQNNLKAVQLTLGNPNFAGALYGLLVLIPYSKLILNKSKKFLFLQYFLLATLVFLSIQTKSLQSFLVLFVCIATYTLLVSKVISEKRRRRIVISLTITSFILVILIGISFFLNSSILKEIISRIIFEGNVTQRLSYWQTALQVFLRNPWFGVGPDQLQLYAAEVRSSKDVLRDGTYTLTDRAHNVFLDQLANGGIFAGLFWLGFVLLVFRLIIKLYRMELESNSLNSLALLASIWIGYLTQGFLSPDHGLLAILGFFSAGLILSIARRENVGYKDFVFAGKMTLIVRIFSAMMMIICLIFWGKALQSDYMTRQVLRGEITDKIETYQVLDSWTNPRAAELIGIYRARNNLDCDIVAKAANKMLEVSERYAQAWYFRGYCDNLKGNPKGAIKNVEKAIEYDPLNPDYILSLVKLNLFMNDKPGAIKWYQILHRNYPENPELKTLLQSIENIT
jgi:O-antigen ligase